ncbi:MAG TPA: oligopeptide transporter, OPT family, partial [Steroidobacteraceae bacterium]|nr:oligopeptide transporter, OPT family [Steroidobacteraceae bacterium]
LVASEVGGGHARQVFVGLAAGAFAKWLTSWVQVIPDHVSAKIPFLRKGEVGSEVSAALFGVGYILGPRVATVMVGGGLLSSLVIIPAIAYWGANRGVPLYPETLLAITEMSPGQIWSRYVRYIGAGAVATAGIITLIRSLPVMLESFHIGAAQLRERLAEGESQTVPRTDDDLPYKYVGIGLVIVAASLAVIPIAFEALDSVLHRAIAALCVVVFAFFFVTVSSRIVGLVGVTSNPTSGMTIASLLATATIFLALGWTDVYGKAAALTVGCVVAIAASIAGDMSQDLKTGYLLGATPRRQQTAELIGVLTSAVFVCGAVLLLSEAFGFGTRELPAPQATLMKLVIDGVIDQSLPWTLVAIGAAIAIVCELARIPSLPFAVGVYLPVATMFPVFLGGLVRLWAERSARDDAARSARRERGVLLGSGFVGGEGLLGVGIAAVAFGTGAKPAGFGTDWIGADWMVPVAGAIAFALFILWFARKVAAAR